MNGDILSCGINILNRNVSIRCSTVYRLPVTQYKTRTGCLHTFMASGMDTAYIQVSCSILTCAGWMRMGMAIKPMWLSKFIHLIKPWASSTTLRLYMFLMMFIVHQACPYIARYQWSLGGVHLLHIAVTATLTGAWWGPRIGDSLLKYTRMRVWWRLHSSVMWRHVVW